MAMEIANFGGPIENEGQQAIAADLQREASFRSLTENPKTLVNIYG